MKHIVGTLHVWLTCCVSDTLWVREGLCTPAPCTTALANLQNSLMGQHGLSLKQSVTMHACGYVCFVHHGSRTLSNESKTLHWKQEYYFIHHVPHIHHIQHTLYATCLMYGKYLSFLPARLKSIITQRVVSFLSSRSKQSISTVYPIFYDLSNVYSIYVYLVS